LQQFLGLLLAVRRETDETERYEGCAEVGMALAPCLAADLNRLAGEGFGPFDVALSERHIGRVRQGGGVARMFGTEGLALDVRASS
jgi:hypothetical protein